MNVRLTARHMPLTAEVKLYCDKRLKGLEKNMGPVAELDILLSREKHRHGVELRAASRGLKAMVKEENADLFSALNEAFDGLEKKIKKEKEKLLERRRRGRREPPVPLPAEDVIEPRKRVIPADEFSLKPMTVEEAILNLDLKKRDVFMFRKLKTEKWALVYRRRDGHFGLVDPD
ncbi:MAG: ribosomal subunit interface protein [Candidatus Aminicenantes bacterium RBG_13_62_12]|nr:MAG: ribosomal subunit interface protein [Candidatus Aminicenantes bacterium RBG_13_62_12]